MSKPAQEKCERLGITFLVLTGPPSYKRLINSCVHHRHYIPRKLQSVFVKHYAPTIWLPLNIIKYNIGNNKKKKKNLFSSILLQVQKGQ